MKPLASIYRLALLILSLAVAADLHADPQVKSIAGGPKSFNALNYGYRDGQTFTNAQFNTPSALAINTSGTFMFVADRTNNAIRQITMPVDVAASQTTTFTTNRLARPWDVAVDGANNVYVLNRGSTAINGAFLSGTIVKFNQYGNYLGTLATNLVNATAFALDASTNIYITISTNSIMRISGLTANLVTQSATNTYGTITNPGTRLQGIAVLDNGALALSDANPTNSGIWLLVPALSNATSATAFTGFHGTNEVFGTAAFATLLQPERIAKAGNGMLVVADRSNHRVKVIDSAGTITNLYGVNSNMWLTVSGTRPGWLDGPGLAYPSPDQARAESREPFGLIVAANGDLYTTEVYYHLLRKITQTGLTGPGGVNNGGGSATNGTGTNNVIIVNAPTINPNTGYFPMGHTILVTSSAPDVFYTTDGSEPTTNSARVSMGGNTGSLVWNNPNHDLTSLRVKAFIGTSASPTVFGVPATTNSVGVPTGRSSSILAGVGSTIILPVVANLRTSDTVKSFQFRVEITPIGGGPAVTTDFSALSISTNDFVTVATAAQGGVSDAVYTAQPYTSNSTQGLTIQTIGSQANVSFQNYAVVAMLSVPIPASAAPGQTYSIQIVWASATSDAGQTPVAFSPTPATTILVTNVSYVVGDCSPSGWYNAGDFGDGNLANNDVNTIFYASVGLRVPDAFSDAFDSMDAFPLDGPGFVGGDGQIRFLDWQITSDRSLRLQTNNWVRAWASAGFRTNSSATLVVPLPPPPLPGPPGLVWYREASVGAISGSNALAGNTVDVPVFAKVVNGANLAGLQFRAVVTPDGVAPALTSPVQFVTAPGMTNPVTQSFNVDQIGCGWQLKSLNFPAQSSNLLGRVRFTIPTNAQAGQTYTVSFANADGSPDLYTQHEFETRSVTVRVGNSPVPTPDGISDEWKINFFGSVLSPYAGASSDPDGDGSSNYEEFLNGTNPTQAASKLKLKAAAVRTVSSQRQLPLQWLSAPGKIYAVERCANLATGNWSTVTTVAGDGYQKEFAETNLTGGAFYRVRVISAP